MIHTRTLAKLALLFALLAVLAFSQSACVTHDIGGEGQSCTNKGECMGELTCCSAMGGICVPYDICHAPDGDEADGDLADGDQDEAEKIELADGDGTELPETDAETVILPLPATLQGKLCSPSGLCLEHPYPIGFSLNDAWLAPDGTFWFVGEQGLRAHFATNNTSPALGGEFTATLATLRGIHGSASNAIWAVGDKNAILFYDGKSWTAQHDSVIDTGSDRSFNAVHADGQGNVYVLGQGGALLRLLNKAWSALGTPNTSDLYDMWNAGTDTYVVVGAKGALFMSKNQYLFTAKSSGTTETLRSVWGTDGSRIFAVGDKGTVLYYDGTTWVPFKFPFPGPAASDGDAEVDSAGWVAKPDFWRIRGNGEKAVLFASDGSLWDLVEGENAEYADQKDAPTFLKTHSFVRRSGDKTAYGLRGGVLRQDGSVLAVGDYGVLAGSPVGGGTLSLYPKAEGADNALAVKGHSVYADVSALGGTATNLYVGLANGLSLRRSSDSAAWISSDALKTGAAIGEIWPFADGNVYFFQDRITVLDSAGQFGELVGADILSQRLKRAVGFADNSFYAVGASIVRFKTSLALVNEPFIAKSYVESPTAPTISDSKGPWNGIWAATPNDIWVVGTEGKIAHRVKNPYTSAVSASEYIWHTETLTPKVDLNDIWGADATHFWIVGDDGNIWVYDGTTFSLVGPGAPYETGENLTRVFGSDATHLLVQSDHGHLWASENGKDFRSLDSGTGGALLAAYARGANALFVAGENGLVLKAEHVFDSQTEVEAEVDGDAEVEAEALDSDENAEALDGDADSDAEPELEAEGEADADTNTTSQGVFSCRTPSDPTLTCGPDCFCQLSPSLFVKPLVGLGRDGTGGLLAVSSDALYQKTSGGWTQLVQASLKAGEALLGAAQASGTGSPIFVLSNTTLYTLAAATLEPVKSTVQEAGGGAWSRFVAIDMDNAGTLYLLEYNPDKSFSLYRRDKSGSFTALATHKTFTVGTGGSTIVTSLATPTPSRIYVAGTNILRYNGSTWVNLNRPTGNDTPHLRVRGFAESSTIVTITGNTAYTYDGTSWGVLPLDPVMIPNDLWGRNVTDLIVVGQSTEANPADRKGLALHLVGGSWQSLPGFTTINPKLVFGSSDGATIVVGGDKGEILLANASTYTFSANQNAPLVKDDLSFIVGASSKLYAGGAHSLLALAGSPQPLLPDAALALPAGTLYSAGACDATGRLYLTTDQLKVLIFDPTTPLWSAISTAANTYQGIVASAPGDFYAGASFAHYDGSSFTNVSWDSGLSAGATQRALYVDGTLYAAGGSSGLLALSSGTMRKAANWPADKPAALLASNGAKLFVAGLFGTSPKPFVLVQKTGGFDDLTLTLPDTLVPQDLAAAGSLVYLLGTNGGRQELWVYDGTFWAQVKAFPQSGVLALYAPSPYDLYVVGEAGLILHQEAKEFEAATP